MLRLVAGSRAVGGEAGARTTQRVGESVQAGQSCSLKMVGTRQALHEW